MAALKEALPDGSDEDIIRADREFHHTVAALAGSLALELIVNLFYRAFDASLDTGGAMKRSIVTLLRAAGALEADAANKRITDALGAQDTQPGSEPGDEEDDDSAQAS